jgi:hypothetical protein
MIAISSRAKNQSPWPHLQLRKNITAVVGYLRHGWESVKD